MFGGETDKINSSSPSLRWFHTLASQGGLVLLMGALLARPPRPTRVTKEGRDDVGCVGRYCGFFVFSTLRQMPAMAVGLALECNGVAGLPVSFCTFDGILALRGHVFQVPLGCHSNIRRRIASVHPKNISTLLPWWSSVLTSLLQANAVLVFSDC